MISPNITDLFLSFQVQILDLLKLYCHYNVKSNEATGNYE